MKSTALPRNLADWLDRQPTPKKRKRIPAKSAKRAAEDKIYSVRRKAFLEENPTCQAWGIIVGEAPVSTIIFGERTSFPHFRPRSEEVHHMKKPKQTYYLDESTWLAVSMWSHDWIEANKSTARKLGLLCY